MPAEQSPTVPPRSSKDVTVMTMVDYIMNTHKPKESACVLMWRELRNGCWPDSPPWTRDHEDVHRHWKQHGKGVIEQLERRSLTIVKVSGEIRRLVDHGKPPNRTGKRTDAAYRNCMPSRNAPTYGIVLFPPEKHEDHPLILASLGRRVQTAGTSFENSVKAVETAKDREIISDESHERFREHAQITSRRALEEKHPLLPRKAIENGKSS